jgi:hypothetical protein
LALLQRRGVAAWLRAWRTSTTVPSSPPADSLPAAVPAGGDEVVGVLASMALACLRAG